MDGCSPVNFLGVFCFLLCFVRSGSSSGRDTGPVGLSTSFPIEGLLPSSRELLLGFVLSWKAALWPVVDGPYSPFSGLACLGGMGKVSRLSAALFLLLLFPVARGTLFSDLVSSTILQGGVCLLMATGLLTGTGLLTTMGLLTGIGLLTGTGFVTVTSLVTGMDLVTGTGLVTGMGLVSGTGLVTGMALVTGMGLVTVTGLLMPMGLLTPTGFPMVTGLLTPMGLLTPTGRLMVTGRLTGPGFGVGRG